MHRLAERTPLVFRPNPLLLAEFVLGPRARDLPIDQCLQTAFGDFERFFVPDPGQPTIVDLFDDQRLRAEEFDSAKAAIDRALELRTGQEADAFRKRMRLDPRVEQNVLAVVPFLALVGTAHIDDAEARHPPRLGSIGRFRLQEGGRLGDPEYDDPVQNNWDDCWLIASLSALAWAGPIDLRKIGLLASRPGQQAHDWQLWPAGLNGPGKVLCVEEDLPWGKDGRALHATSNDAGELWPGIVEKAWVMDHAGGSFVNDLAPHSTPGYMEYFKALNAEGRALPPYAMQRLTGWKRSDIKFRRTVALSQVLESLCLATNAGRCTVPAVAWTAQETELTAQEEKRMKEAFKIWPQHAYTVLGTLDGHHVVLRDPIRRQLKPAPVAQQLPWGVPLAAPGITVLPLKVFDELFHAIGWVTPPPPP